MSLVQFGLYFFAFLLTESIVNDRAVSVCGVSNVNYVYAIGLLFTALGYLIFSYIKKTNKKFLVAILLLSALAMVGIMKIEIAPIFIATSYLCLVLLGYIGGYIHYHCSLNLQNKNFALYLGISSMFGIIMQYIAQNFGLSTDGCIISVIAAIILMILIMIVSNSHSVEKSIIPVKSFPISGISTIKRIWIYAACVAIMSTILGFQDSIIVAKNANGELQLFSYVRLLYALGLLVAGLIANIKDRVYLPLASGCAMILSVLAISFFENTNSLYNISMGIMYFYCGFYVMFMTIMFMELGIRKSNPELFAGLGRVIRCVVTCIVVLATTLISNNYADATIYTILSCILSISLLLILALSGILLPERTILNNQMTAPVAEQSFDDKLISIYAKYSLTPKEQEAFQKLITSEMSVQEIADEMGISRRVLQRHIASIYEKTGTKTRIGLLMLLTP